MGAVALQIVSSIDAAKILGVTDARVRQLCIAGRIEGAKKIGSVWLVPVKIARNGRRSIDVAPVKMGRPAGR
ncbi:MAG: hypothetical protein AMXMBFR42_16860 [Burkholderiales bacterium]